MLGERHELSGVKKDFARSTAQHRLTEWRHVQALQQLRTGRKLLLGLAAALLLAAAAQLGRGAPPISVAAAAPVLGALASVWLSEKFAGWQAKFVYSDYDHTARD